MKAHGIRRRGAPARKWSRFRGVSSLCISQSRPKSACIPFRPLAQCTHSTNREILMAHDTFQAGDLTAIIGDNSASGMHRAGYNGLWSLTHRTEPANLFVPTVAGLN